MPSLSSQPYSGSSPPPAMCSSARLRGSSVWCRRVAAALAITTTRSAAITKLAGEMKLGLRQALLTPSWYSALAAKLAALSRA